MLTNLKLSPEELKKLSYERYHYPCPVVQKRLHAIYLKAISGFSNKVVCKLCDAHSNSLIKWLAIYKQQGMDGLCKMPQGHNQSLLETQVTGIEESFTQQPPRSTDEARLKIQMLTGIERSKTRIRAFMKRHHFPFLKTGHIPARVNTTAQKTWVNQTLQPAIEAAKEGQIHLLFMDAAHFVLQPFLCSLWCITRVFIKAAAGRNRINVLGAVHALTKQITTSTNTEFVDANTIVAFLKQLKQQYPDKPIAIILDNARYQQ